MRPRRQLAPFLRRSGYANDKDIRRRADQVGKREVSAFFVRHGIDGTESPADTILHLIAHFIEASTMLMDCRVAGVRSYWR